jgi:hypothetical protein
MGDRTIRRVLSVVDTRALDEDTYKPIAGTGDEHACDRCGRMHEIHVTVELADGSQALIGTTCATGDDLDTVRRAVASAATLRRLAAQLDRARADYARIQAVDQEIRALPLPEITAELDGDRTVFHMGDARVWQWEVGPITDERRDTLVDAWRGLRMAEREGSPFALGRAYSRLEDVERRHRRAVKRAESQ